GGEQIMFVASRNTNQRIAAAALALGALLTASSVAQVNTATTQVQTDNTQVQTGNSTTAGSTAGVSSTLANPALPAVAAQNVVAESLGLTFANTPGNTLVITAVAPNSPLAGIGLQV